MVRASRRSVLHWRLLVLSAGAVVVLAGCNADVATDITITGSDSADVTVTSTFTGDAATALANDPELAARIEAFYTEHTGEAPKVSTAGDTTTYTAAVPYREIGETSPFTGVDSVLLFEEPSDDLVNVQVSVGDAYGLEQAIAASADRLGNQATTDELIDATTLTLDVHFPGGIESFNWGRGAQTAVSAKTGRLEGVIKGTGGGAGDIHLVRPLRDPLQTTITATGHPGTRPWFLIAGLVAAATALGLVLLARRNKRLAEDAARGTSQATGVGTS